MKKNYFSKEEFLRDRISMHLGSLANLYSHSPNPPPPDELFKKAVEITEKVWEAGNIYDEFPELEEKLLEKIAEEQNLHERQIGRYYASELYAYFTDKIPPHLFLTPPEPSREEIRTMFWGTIIHEGLQKLFNFEEVKYELDITNEIVLVCKPDLILPDGTLIEIKTKENLSLYEEVPPWHFFQCQAYLEALGKKEMKLYVFSWGLARKLFVVKKDEKVWENIKKNLINYHQKVKKAYST